MALVALGRELDAGPLGALVPLCPSNHAKSKAGSGKAKAQHQHRAPALEVGRRCEQGR